MYVVLGKPTACLSILSVSMRVSPWVKDYTHLMLLSICSSLCLLTHCHKIFTLAFLDREQSRTLSFVCEGSQAMEWREDYRCWLCSVMIESCIMLTKQRIRCILHSFLSCPWNFVNQVQRVSLLKWQNTLTFRRCCVALSNTFWDAHFFC